MIFSYNWLNSFFKEDLPSPEELSQKLTVRLFEVEKIKEKEGDFLLDVDILPNRASDCFSHLGLAKEIAAIFNFSLIEPEIKINEKGEEIEKIATLKVEEKELCPGYLLRGVEGIKIGETPSFIKERIEACNLKSVNNVVDIINYVMLETGQPLHAFDREKVEGPIIVRKAKKEKIKTLEGEDYLLDEDLIISDKEKPLAIAGIKGGKEAEIDKETSSILLEAANFERVGIRKTSQKLKLRTDASVRFEHGLSPSLINQASKRAVYLLEKYAKGEVMKGHLSFFKEKEKEVKVKLTGKEASSLLGVEITDKEVKDILKKLNFKEEGKMVFVSPLERTDISLPEDLIEEIGRIYGYENIPPKMPKRDISPPVKDKFFTKRKRVGEILKRMGYQESYNYSFIDQKIKDIFSFKNLIEMENPVSLEHLYLRPTLIPNLLKNIEKNQKEFNKINIFEIGKIFPKEERVSLSGVKTNSSFRRLKGDLEVVLEEMGVEDIDYSPIKENTWDWEACQVKVKGKEVGYLGKISPQIKEKMKLEGEIFAFEINLEKVLSLSLKEKRYLKVSKFPPALRDISLLTPQKVLYKEVKEIVLKAGGDNLERVDLFDLYKGKNIPSGKKNFGLRLLFRSKERTLSSEEINKLLKKIIGALEDKPDWKVRK